jgi:hypothetical protein
MDNHKNFMLQSLNMSIAQSVAKLLGASEEHQHDDDPLEKHVLLCIGQRVMLSCNLWVQAGLVNGALKVVMQIVYASGSNPPNAPTYVLVAFDKYIGPFKDQSQPKHVLIPPIQQSNKKQIPLKMAWTLTIHKSEGMTLTRSTIDIGNIERQGLTFMEMSCTTTIEGM